MVESNAWFRLRWFVIGSLAAVTTAFGMKIAKQGSPVPAEVTAAPRVVAVPVVAEPTPTLDQVIDAYAAAPGSTEAASAVDRAFGAAQSGLSVQARAALDDCLGEAATVASTERAARWRTCAALIEEPAR